MQKLNKLDKDTVAGLAPGKYWYCGGKISGIEVPRGFGVRVLADVNGNATTRSYVLRYGVNGKERLHRIGQTTDMTAVEAVRAARDLRKLVNRGEDPVGQKHQAKEMAKTDEENRFDKVCEKYFSTRDSDMRSKDKMKDVVERLLYPDFEHRDVTTIKRNEIVVLCETIDAENGREMSNKTFAFLRTILNAHAARSDDFNSPIVRGMRNLKKGKRNRMLLNPEVAAIWRATKDPADVYGRYIRFLLLTACRRDEAANLTWDEITDGVWLLPATRNKTKVDLMRPLSAAALACLPSKRQGKYVFSLDGGKTSIAKSNMTRMHVALLEASGTTGWVRHDLRRTARSLMPRASVPTEHAEECLGHLRPGIVSVYNVYEYLDEKKVAYDKLARLVDNLVDPQSNVIRLKTAGAVQAG